MRLKNLLLRVAVCVLFTAGIASLTFAGSTSVSDVSASSTDTRYGWLGLLDHRSTYGQGVFPEPFLVDDSDLETNEFRLDWFHGRANSLRTDDLTVELEKGFGLLTLEVEFHYDRDATPEDKSLGIGNLDLGARYPLFQYVSANGVVDSTFGAAIEVGVPTYSSISKNMEVVPKLFNDLRLGSHFTLQSIVGYSILCGGGDDRGIQTFEYGFVFGYAIPHKELPIPGVQQLIPVFEISGEKQLNKDDAGQNSVLGNVGFRANMKTIGKVQPRLGLGFVFPMNSVAREDLHWGIYTSLVFEY